MQKKHFKIQVSFKKLFSFLLWLAIGIQIIIISYNHLSGYSPVKGFLHFFVKLIYSSALSLAASFMLAYPALIIINWLNTKSPWSISPVKRIAVQVSLTTFIAVAVSTFITLFAYSIYQYTDNLLSVLLANALIFIAVNILLTAVLEAWSYYSENNQSKAKAAILERELSQIKYEMLKSQINPHFMFNSLNVLSGLIEKDPKTAQDFVDEFAIIYRYVLETIEKPMVTLSEELGFARSYFFLQRMRYGDFLLLNIDVPSGLLAKLLPPLSLQTVLENAIKHNVINEALPLNIEIYSEDDWLLIRNNLQAKISKAVSTGLGQKNILKRYALICERVPQFAVKTSHYLVKLPLIDYEDYANTDN